MRKRNGINDMCALCCENDDGGNYDDEEKHISYKNIII